VPRFDAVLFDLDGTLLDSAELILTSYRHTLVAHGLPLPEDAEIRTGVGQPLEKQFSRWVQDTDEIARMVDTYRAHNLTIHDEMAAAFPGVNELVHKLHQHGTKLAIVTSKRREGTLRGLKKLGLADRFEVIITCDEVDRPKPHPEPVERALTALGGVDPARAVFVGDSTHDVHSGKAAGVHTVAVAWGVAAPEVLRDARPHSFVEDVRALAELLLGR
jgi:pyrophosphatase PpaX